LHALRFPPGVEWEGDPYALTQSLTFDMSNKASIVSCIVAARENSRHVREQISTEQWHRLNSLYLYVIRPEVRREIHADAVTSGLAEPAEFLQSILEAVHQFQGVTDSTMSHGEGWQFIQVGCYIERATATAMLLEAYQESLWQCADRIADGNEYIDWMGLLRSATAFEAYCKVYTADLTPDQILEFLLLDEKFPHSLRFAIDSMQHALEAIYLESGKHHAEPLRRLSGRLQAALSYSSVEDILNQNAVDYLRNIQQQCREIHEMIYALYVDYSIHAALAG
jgi:uncharacterized alpha-E superfamily protein